ncbi:MAG: hypothetical protein ABH824_03960 [Nanoarchaeota archaeon]|nr:hypothetical protein [Nanoarchaeota archaeon]MBU1632559.1 hypothetical protein [Nanoarchaeota archaeon]MBU1876578.1 hypothetical protein [Nanoarchaeota archaeon]
MNKKGQIRMSETIAVLFIFFVLILFGLVFYSKYQTVALKEKQEELLANRAIETTLRTLFLPELICSDGETEPEDNCFDMLKLRLLNETLQRNLDDYYFELFSYAKIEVQEVYPGNATYLLYDKPKPNFKSRESTYFVITLRDELIGKGEASNSFGYVKVGVYS